MLVVTREVHWVLASSGQCPREVVELVGGGSVINGAYPVYFLNMFLKNIVTT